MAYSLEAKSSSSSLHRFPGLNPTAIILCAGAGKSFSRTNRRFLAISLSVSPDISLVAMYPTRFTSLSIAVSWLATASHHPVNFACGISSGGSIGPGLSARGFAGGGTKAGRGNATGAEETGDDASKAVRTSQKAFACWTGDGAGTNGVAWGGCPHMLVSTVWNAVGADCSIGPPKSLANGAAGAG